MFQCCSIAKNTIRFSFSHSLTSLFCFTLFFFPATYVVLTLPHSLAFARLALVIFLASSPLFSSTPSDSPTTLLLLLLFHQTPTLLTPPFVSYDREPWFPSSPIFPSSFPSSTSNTASFLTSFFTPFFHYFPVFHPFSIIILPLSFPPRNCWVCQHGCCSTRLSGCFSTRRIRTANTNHEPSGVSAHLLAKCKPPCTPCYQAGAETDW